MKVIFAFYLLFPFLALNQDAVSLQLYDAVENQPDSVITISLAELDKNPSPTIISDYYYIIALAQNNLSNWGKSLSYLEKVDSLSLIHPASAKRQLETAVLKSKNYYGQGQLILADQTLTQSEVLFNSVYDYEIKATYLLHKGWLAREQGKHGYALDIYLEAKIIIQANNDDRLLADCYSKIAVVYHVIGDYKTAEDYYDKTLEMYQQLGMKKAEGRLYNNYGLLYQSLGRSTEAAVYFEKSIEMCTDYNNTRGVAIANENIGLLWFEDLGNNAMALSKFNKSLAVWKNTNDIYGQAQTLVYMMYVHNDNQDFNKAIIAGNESLIYALESGAKDVERDLYKELYIAHEGLNQNNKAFYYYKKHIALKDSLSSFNEFDKIKMVTLKHELEKENLQDSLNIVVEYEKKAVATASEIKLQRFWTGLLSLGFIGLMVIVFLLHKSKKQRQKSAAIIEETNKKLTIKNAEIIDSINYAKHIQSSILPSPEQVNRALNDCDILYLPKDIVAGDFYWLATTVTVENKTKSFFAVADCTGHGVPGAMVSIVCSSALNKAVNEHKLTVPGEILEEVTKIVIAAFDQGEYSVNDGMDISLISIEKGNDNSFNVEFSGANNPFWFIRQASGLIEEEKGTKRPVGKFGLPIPFETKSFVFQPGDALYLFSDGFPDQFGGPKNKKYKYKTLKSLFEKLNPLSTQLQVSKMKETLAEWSGENEQIDDVCIAVIKF